MFEARAPFFRSRPSRPELRRYRQVFAVLAKYGFDDILARLSDKVDIPWSDSLFKRHSTKARGLSTPQRFRLAIEELGPIYVKFGQVLASRPDLLPEEIVLELSKLQDNVPPFPLSDVRAIIVEQFGRPLEDLYDVFEETPSGAASLSQVHFARTKDGKDVAVKVQRPGIVDVINADLLILRRLAMLAERSLEECRAYRLVSLVDDFEETIHRELDFIREGRNADRFRESFTGDETVHVPYICWDLTAPRVLTMEYIHGTKVSDIRGLEAKGFDRRTIAQNGANLILKEIFEINRFHADPHAGNLFILDGNVIAPVDFGMVGVLDEQMVDQLSAVFMAIVDKDPELMAKVVLQMCDTPDTLHEDALRRDLADLLDRYDEAPLQHLDLQDIISRATRILRRYRLQFPREMALVTRALLMIEAVGCHLYPEFNVLEIMKPFARKLAMRKADPLARFHDAVKGLNASAVLMKTLPSDIQEIVAKVRNNDVSIRFEHRGLERMASTLEVSGNRLSLAIITASLILVSSSALQSWAEANMSDSSGPGIVGFSLAVLFGLWVLIGIMRSGRRGTPQKLLAQDRYNRDRTRISE